MRTRLFHFLSAAAATFALCCACADEIEPVGSLAEPQPLVFTASQGDLTLGTRAAADDKWEGDGTEFVAIKIGDIVKKYKVTSFADKLEPVDSDNTFYRTDKSDIDVSAWYPYKDNQLSQPTQPNILIDQSSKANREASNLMIATATAKFGETSTLEFKHQTARLRLLLYGEDDKPLAAGATVKFNGGTTWITAYNEGDGYYSALVSPVKKTSIEKDEVFFTVTIEGVGTYNAKAPSKITLTAGQSYEFSYSLKRDLVNTRGIEVTLSGTELEYTGSTVRPTVTVTYNGTALTEDTDYTLSWSSSTSSAVGSYTVDVNGKGAYVGSVQKSYTIVEAPPYVTFSAEEEQTFTMTLPKVSSSSTAQLEAAAKLGMFEYSVGGGTWTKITSGEAVPFGGDKGDLRLRGTGLNSNGEEALYGTSVKAAISEYQTSYLNSKISFANSSVSVKASGDIRTLIAYRTYDTVATSEARFYNLFNGCAVLTSAPELPATDLADYCYAYMFSGCTNLEAAPSLPAMTLADNCYYYMFSECMGLASAPELNAESLTKYCYAYMFSGCTGLTSAPELKAATLAGWCYQGMFSRCAKLTSAPELPVTALETGCYLCMFQGCSGLTSAPELKATTLASSCYYLMFSDCTGLTSAPKLPATTLASSCYYLMFSGCTNLLTAPVLSVTTLADNCYYGMFSGCTKLATAPKLPATTLKQYCYSDMFNGCTELTSAPELPATTLANYCYQRMFSGCAKLAAPPKLKATTLKNYCYSEMFSGCTALATAPDLPGTTLAPSCYSKMFQGCTALAAGPELPATTLSTQCYYYMFDGCTNLKSVTIKATNILGTSYRTVQNWLPAFSDEASNPTRTIYKSKVLEESTLSSAGGIPTGWKCDNYDEPKCFYVEAVTAGATVSMTGGNSVNLIYSTDGKTWNKFSTYSPSVTLSNAGDKVWIKAGKISYGEVTDGENKKLGNIFGFTDFSEKVNVGGDITTLLSTAGGISDLSSYDTYTFYILFWNCTNLISAENLSLPSTTLVENCYRSMFEGCTGLTSAPELPATTLADYCYLNMFYGCSSLKTAPELKATTLGKQCYQAMFKGCSSLEAAPALPATTLTGYCYNSMFEDCTSLTSAPELKAETLTSACYQMMFKGCTALTAAPELPAKTLTDRCYMEMFNGCTGLKSVTIKATSNSASQALSDWLSARSDNAGIIYYSDNSTSNILNNASAIPTGWTATKLSN